MLDFRILGPFEVTENDETLALGSPRQRALLAILLLHRGELVASDRLIDALWGERPPPSATKILQGYISHLRKVLGEQRLTTRGGGYALIAEPEQVDAERFAKLASEGRELLGAGDPSGAREALDQALSLWRGDALADFVYEPFAEAEVARLTEARLGAEEDRIDADLALGRHRNVTAELEALYRRHPTRERLLAQLMLALYRSGRQADALEAYRRGRASLSDELGLEPGPELRALEQRVLSQDPGLDLVAVPGPDPTSGGFSAPPRRRPLRGRALVTAGAVLLLLAAVAATVAELSSRGAASIQAGANSVAEINVRSDRVTAATDVGAGPGGIAYGDGSLWVANQDDETVSRLSPSTLRALGTIQLRQQPTGIAAAGGAVWVVESNPTENFITATRIDPQFDAVDDTVRIANVDPATPASITAAGDEVWVAPQSGDLTRLSSTSAKPLEHVDPNASPTGLVSAYGALWLTDSQAGNVIRVDSSGLRTAFPVGDGPSGVAAGAGAVWVADTSDDTLVRIDPQNDTTVIRIPVGDAPAGVAVGEGSVWVANSGDGTISRIDPRTNRVIAKIDVGGSPQSLVTKGGRVWVTVDAAPFSSVSVSRQGGTLRVDSGTSVESMDPAIAYDFLSWGLLYTSCAKLLDYADRSGSGGLELVPEVAATLPTVSDSGRTYSFTIRKGFRFAPPSNQLVTAETFKTTIERTLNPRMHSPLASTFADIVGAGAYMAGRARGISGLAVAGDTLTIHLTAPDPDLPTRLAMPFFCAVPSDTPIDPNGVAVIPSAGPYTVESNTPQGIELVRNPNYHGDRPHHFDRIEVAENVPGRQAIKAVEAGTADYADEFEFKSADVQRLATRYGAHSPAGRSGHQQYFATVEPGIEFFVLNTHRPLFSNQRLREAVNYAIDRGALARLGGQLSTLPDAVFDHYVPPGVPGYSDVSVFGAKPDLARAKRLAAGYAGATVVLYTCDYAPCPQQAQIVKTDLAKIGLHVKVVEFGSGLYSHVARAGEPFDMAFVNWFADYADPDDFLNGLLESGTFLPTFRNPGVARKLAEVAQLTGTRRYLAYAKLDIELAKTAAPFAVYGIPYSHNLFSARIGCQVFSPVYGVDFAALCLRSKR